MRTSWGPRQRLFERNKHGVAITEAGAVFRNGVKQTLAHLDSTLKAVKRAAQGQVGTLALGFGGSAVYTFMPSLLRRFRRNFPDVELSLHNIPVPSQLEALLERRIDIGFVTLPVRNEAIATKISYGMR